MNESYLHKNRVLSHSSRRRSNSLELVQEESESLLSIDLDSILSESEHNYSQHGVERKEESKEKVSDTAAPLEPRDAIPAQHTKENLCVYWHDAHEEDGRSSEVYLFGKVLDATSNTYQSICAIIKGIERRCYIVPKKNVGILGVIS